MTVLAHRERGAGPALLLLHGFTGSSAIWAAHVPAWTPRHRVIAVDLLGHGRAAAPTDPSRYTIERATADLAALLDALDVERTACLGYSMGGRLALAFALTHPQRISALVLESASPGIADPAERAARAARDMALAERIESDGVARFVEEWMAQPLFASQARLAPGTRRSAQAIRLGNSAVGLANSLRRCGTGAQPSYWERLGELTVPTLLLAGELDAKFRAIATAMRERIGHARLSIVTGAGHATHLERPADFRALVGSFLGHLTIPPPSPPQRRRAAALQRSA